MAEIAKGILGGVSGKVGNLVGTNWRGKNVIRSLPTKKKASPTNSQLLQREKFKIIAQFMTPLIPITSKYFGEIKGTKSRTNLAMSYHLKEAIIENNGKFEIDYSKVLVTKGELPPVVIERSIVENDELKLSWTSMVGMALGKEVDRVVVVIYSELENLFSIIEGETTRGDGILKVKISKDWIPNTQAVWLYSVSENDLNCSSSQYLGKF